MPTTKRATSRETARPIVDRVGVRRPKARVRGLDLAGVVEAVGSRVTTFSPALGRIPHRRRSRSARCGGGMPWRRSP